MRAVLLASATIVRLKPRRATLTGRPLQSATMASRALKLQLQGDERGLLRQNMLGCYVPAKHMREVSAGITSH